jgi:hypothetical protein
MDVENKYKRFNLYNPVVQCPPGRDLRQFGGWLDPNVSSAAAWATSAGAGKQCGSHIASCVGAL